jgi:sigma-B regulation protein RsbU (phosphoserine phosphatase)
VIKVFLNSFRFKVMALFVIVMALAGALSNLLIYHYSEGSQLSQLRRNLMTLSQTIALSIDIEQRSPDDIYLRLKKIAGSIPAVKYIYILEKTDKPDILRFVVDAGAGRGRDESETAPGDEYDASPFPEMMKAFDAPSADYRPVADKWGVALSGYAPVRDISGNAVAIVGVDIAASDVHKAQTVLRRAVIFVFCLGLVVSLFMGLFISGNVTGRIVDLAKGAEAIGKGDLEHMVRVKGNDEISALGGVFNKMTGDLKNYMAEIEHATAERQKMDSELEIAKGIQDSLIPESAPFMDGVEIAAVTIPARVVGGDFYDFIPIDTHRCGILIADVSGKGIPAAIYMALSKALMRSSASVTGSPGEAIKHANSHILELSKADMFVTLFYGIYDSAERVMRYANAGHNSPIFIEKGSNKIVLLSAHTMPIGIMREFRISTEQVALSKGDTILLYTDGVVEAANEAGEFYDMSRLEKVVGEAGSLTAGETVKRIQGELAEFAGGAPQRDDITMVVIKVL